MDVYQQVFEVARIYLGPATEKFIERQCRYMKIEMRALTKADLKQLAWLSKNAASTVMDPAQAEKLARSIEGA
jgi:hypothetical protein